MDVVVTGIGLVSALGNLQNSWKRLLAGESGIEIHQPFLELEPRVLALVGTKPADLISLILPVLAEALQDANLTLPLRDCGIAIGSSRGFQGNLEQLGSEGRGKREEGRRKREEGRGKREEGRECSILDRPFPITDYRFVDFLPHMGAIAAARAIGSTGPVLAPMAACATGLQSIARAVDLIRTGECQRAIAGAVEAPITPLTVAGFNRMGALADTGCYPFDQHREGLVLGEGGALFVLESAELASRRGAKIYGRVSGFGLTNDACYATAPDIGGESAIAAVNQCLKRSNLAAVDIDFVHAHGTATDLNDRQEALLIQKLFRPGVAVSSTKGATAHTLGASGALGAAFCLMSIRDGILPPCTGLKKPGFELDFVRCGRSTLVRNAICLSFGFGGQNAAIVLSGDR
ncbi:beta-ketoacyl-ACP synthase [Tychonema sp. LEGE 07199]|uniref:beta-ketoacyl-ACP synthase n=1 Tax=unclassified Tychonema TaxID=2642144 RepID=UPI0018810032|nr:MULTISPECIES: beta-ketoacyl-ACP synthase [unclassified Tychonema]MBE9124382.1 beta-ketoacyl-ACP synthase [Tychonema sp. LEGE 07199]MBE9135510.1 beta-ketoacyl-ACP synthase [Tychonema sp. LEGE 07196]